MEGLELSGVIGLLIETAANSFTAEMEAATLSDDPLGALSLLASKVADGQTVLAQLAAILSTELVNLDVIGQEGFMLEGGGHLMLRVPKTRQVYDQPRLISRIASELASGYQVVVDDGGESLPAEGFMQNVVQTLASLVGVTPSFNSWRKGHADELGIDLREYRETDWGTPTVKVEGRPSPLPELQPPTPDPVQRVTSLREDA